MTTNVSARVGRESASAQTVKRLGSGLPFLVPFAVVAVLFLIVPILYGLWLSFTEQSLMGHGGWIGTANYVRVVRGAEIGDNRGQIDYTPVSEAAVIRLKDPVDYHGFFPCDLEEKIAYELLHLIFERSALAVRAAQQGAQGVFFGVAALGGYLGEQRRHAQALQLAG